MPRRMGGICRDMDGCSEVLSDISGWSGDGIITRIESEADADLFAQLGKPVVDVAGAYTRSVFNQVNNDDFLTGKKAGVHLAERGFGNLHTAA